MTHGAPFFSPGPTFVLGFQTAYVFYTRCFIKSTLLLSFKIQTNDDQSSIYTKFLPSLISFSFSLPFFFG